MRRRFVIAAEGLTPESEAKLREYFGKLGAWWHWIANFWLLTTTDEEVTAAKIADHIKSLKTGDLRVLVFEFPEDIDWASSGKKNAKGAAQADWLKNSWSKE